ncbi:MAG: LPS translocon maturation chaperone LptM [Pseudomonadota bacterium]
MTATRLFTIALLLIGLSACGQKGALYVPDKQAGQQGMTE